MKKIILFALMMLVMSVSVLADSPLTHPELDMDQVVMYDTFTRELVDELGNLDKPSDLAWGTENIQPGNKDLNVNDGVMKALVNYGDSGDLKAILSFPGNPLTGVFTFEMDLNMVDYGPTGEVGAVWMINDPLPRIFWNADGTSINLYSDSHGISDPIPYNQNQWYHYKVTYDLTQKTVVLTVDDGTDVIGTVTSAWNADVESFDYLWYYFWWDGTKTVYIDNFLAYSGDEYPAVPEIPRTPVPAEYTPYSYSHHQLINCSEVAAGTPVAINGGDGFLFNQEPQTVWVQCKPNLYLHYNDTVYVVGTPTTQSPMDVEVGIMESFNPADVWDDNYVAVYHLTDLEGIGGTLTNAGGGFPHDEWCAIGDCYSFGGDENGHLTTPALVVGPNSPMTIEAWGLDMAPARYDCLLGMSGGGARFVWVPNEDTPPADVWSVIVNNWQIISTSLPADSSMHHHVVTADGTVNFYVDNSLAATAAGDLYQVESPTLFIGSAEDTNWNWPGSVDEVRVSNINRGAAYVNDVYQNVLGSGGYGVLGVDTELPVPQEPEEESSSSHTRYLVDASGNVVGVQYGNQVVTTPQQQAPFLSLTGGQGFDLGGWLKGLWAQLVALFGGK